MVVNPRPSFCFEQRFKIVSLSIPTPTPTSTPTLLRPGRAQSSRLSASGEKVSGVIRARHFFRHRQCGYLEGVRHALPPRTAILPIRQQQRRLLGSEIEGDSVSPAFSAITNAKVRLGIRSRQRGGNSEEIKRRRPDDLSGGRWSRREDAGLAK